MSDCELGQLFLYSGYFARIWIQGPTVWSHEPGFNPILPFRSHMPQSDSWLLPDPNSLDFFDLLFLDKNSPKPFHMKKAEQRLRTWNLASDGLSWVPFLTLISYVTLENLSKTQFLHL